MREAGSGRPLVFLHGWTMDASIFEGQFGRLSDRFHCLAPDLPGHGTARDGAPTLEAAADAVDALLRELSEVVLIGWSMGASVAWSYVRRHGAEALAGLVTVDMSPRLLNGPGWPHGLLGQERAGARAMAARFDADWEGGAQAIASTMFATRDGVPGYGRDRAMRQVTSNEPETMRRIWRALVAADLRDVVPRVPVPVLACHGARSRVYPASAAEWIAGASPQGRRLAFEMSGHSPHLEEPDAFAEAIAKFAGQGACEHAP
ncbi:Pimeloyl-ACP methyl ester carboxylesterase [Tranquillimonas alkanivorans]|uniref:Pimeloyl-ACP methyl ester carboxylesterase n=1 Tax=Tranquillimonas alkanivorans TaxID=441119 RepID=A0A1I5URF3_9RHOB|nr:Pimeloyl-ACP methyl ester carboxylesterase [Tranquillimonas alkanivorans]